jgi:hypothetical protein
MKSSWGDATPAVQKPSAGRFFGMVPDDFDSPTRMAPPDALMLRTAW